MNVKKANFVLAFFVVLCLPACKSSGGNRKATRTLFYEYEARFTDVPLPLAAKPLRVEEQEAGRRVVMTYRLESDRDVITMWYRHEMERNGWQESGVFVGNEPLLQFSKPHRLCSVFMRPLKKDLFEIRVFIAIT